MRQSIHEILALLVAGKRRCVAADERGAGRLASWIIVAALVAAPVACWATAGTLDPSFGINGKVTVESVPPNGQHCGAWNLVLQPDGKLVVTTTCGGSELIRYNPDGSLDASFGTGGAAHVPYRSPLALQLQPDGKLVVAARSNWQPPSGWDGVYPGDSMMLARYDADGSLDTTFGTGGFATAAPIFISALVIQPDGRLVTSGVANPNRHSLLALARYNTDGSLDSTFGTGGMTTSDFGNRSAVAWTLLLQPDGKLVSTANTPYDDGFFLIRFHSDGSLDESFGTHGVASATLGQGPCGISPLALAQQADGKLIAGGGSTVCAFGLARFNVDGSLDPTFGNGGTLSTALHAVSHGAYITNLLVDLNGKIVAGGWAGSIQGGAYAMVRYNADGSIDTSFGAAGIVMPAVVNKALIQQPDSQLVGSAGALARYTGGVCGNDSTEPGEECDDGNLIDGDGCDSNCTYPACGNGIIDNGEECDDGNVIDGDGCSATCIQQLIPGGGPAATDCLTEWGVVNPNNRPLLDAHRHVSRRQLCVDNDPSCDFDGGVVGSCTFHVKVCVNVSDASLPICTPAPLVNCEVMTPSVRDAFRSLDASILRTRVYEMTEATMGNANNTCSSPFDINVPTRGRRPGRQVIRMRTTTISTKRDIDTLTFVCKP